MVSISMVTSNLIFAITSMVNHTYANSQDAEIQQASKEERWDSCIDGGSGSSRQFSHDNNSQQQEQHLKDGPYKWRVGTQTLLLGIASFGQIIGTLIALFIYDFCFLRPILAVSLIWCGLLNLLTPEIVEVASSSGLMISRFSIGVYEGLVVPAPNLITKKWFNFEEKDVAMTIMYSGTYVSVMSFAAVGPLVDTLGWQSVFRIPGVISTVCGLSFLVFFTDDPSENIFVSEEEARRLKNPWVGGRQRSRAGPILTKHSISKTASFYQRDMSPRNWMSAMVRLQVARKQREKGAPLMNALTYAPVWAVIWGSFAVAWTFESSTVYTQLYLQEMHGFSLGETSMLNSM